MYRPVTDLKVLRILILKTTLRDGYYFDLFLMMKEQKIR